MAVYAVLRLHILPEKFIIEPLGAPGKEDLLVIDRTTQDMTLQGSEDQIPSSAVSKTIYGVMGIIHLVAGPYLIAITERQKVGEVSKHEVWKVTRTEVLSYNTSLTHLTDRQMTVNKSYLSLVHIMLNMENFYFSPTYDLTHTRQRLYTAGGDFYTKDLHARADQRFVWNSHVLRELAQRPGLGRFCMPVILGLVKIITVEVNHQKIDNILVSRRCIDRAGTRFNVRGVDPQGHVANFVETEQIIQHDDSSFSFVQTRGSIPILWSQKANLSRVPRPVVRDINHLPAFQKHLEQQILCYGDQVIVNLVNHYGREHVLEKVLSKVVASAKNKSVRYEPFNFNKECGHMRLDRLSILLNRLEPDRKKFGYFTEQREPSITITQKGVFRTNCVDCLDRTNIVQSLLARVTVQEQLLKLGILTEDQGMTELKQFESVFSNVWADNADVISKQYAGSGALRTDYTRTGKRTLYGAFQDGLKSATRYIKNNFLDGDQQDAIDLFLGNYIVEENEGFTVKSPLETDKNWKYYTVPLMFIAACSMLLFCIVFPSEHLTKQALYVLFWGAISVLSVATIFRNGAIFVNHPRLDKNKARIE